MAEGIEYPAVAIDPSDPNKVCALPEWDYIYVSSDGGSTWANYYTGANMTVLAIDPKTPAAIYAGTYDGVYKSVDAGAN